MSNAAANHLRSLGPAIMDRWDERVRSEVPAAFSPEEVVLGDHLTQMLEVLAKTLSDETDPRTAVRDLSLINAHGEERAAIVSYSLEEAILECQILQEVVFDFLEPEHLLNHRDRSIVVKYFGEVVRVAAGQYARSQTDQASRAQREVRESEYRYRTLFNSIDEGFCLIEVLFDAENKPVDYLFLETNPVFEDHTGLHNAVGKLVSELVPDLEKHWYETYGKVALTGEPVRFVNEARAMDARWFDVNAFRLGGPESRKVALLFTDITDRKNAEREREQLIARLSSEHARMADLLQQAPAFVAILRGPNYVFEIVNPLYTQLVGHRDLLGKPVLEALPEVKGQGFLELLDHVYETGEGFVGNEMAIMLQRQKTGPAEERYINFVYQALREPDGAISGIFAHGIDVTEQVLDRRELVRKAEELVEADRAKDEFLAMLGHELRNPLNGISNAVYLVRRHGEKTPELQRPLDTLARQTDHLGRLVNDLLDVARITQGKIALQRKRTALDTAVIATMQGLRPQIYAKGLHLRLEVGDALTVSVDPVRLEQILVNLVTNAIKYTEKGTISVSVRSKNGNAVVAITDTGAGIAPDMLTKIFGLFTQVGATVDRSRGGLGIGLTLVKRLVEMHGGRVEAQSDGIGKGSTFTVRLPLAEPVPPVAESQPLTVEKAESSLHALVVDDNVDAAETLADILAIWGHTADAAHDGEAALRMAAKRRPDIVLLDIGLPGMDGYEVARRLRGISGMEAVSIIALTGYGQDDDRRRTRDAGFNHHLNKPVDLEALQRLMARPAGYD